MVGQSQSVARLRKVEQHVMDIRRPDAQGVSGEPPRRSSAKPRLPRLSDSRGTGDLGKTGQHDD